MKNNNSYYPLMLKCILSLEGGYVNHPCDKGGATNCGITTTTYNAYRKSKGLKSNDIKNITQDEIEEIYYNNYYKLSGANKIQNPQLALYVFDTAVNMGVSVALNLFNKCNNNLDIFEKLRREKYKSYADTDPTQKIFLKGWNNRVTHVKNFAMTNLPDKMTI
ncbi:hypothetical protein IJO12_01060 [bacterium]|nr:hypothetical protein [bacterium]